MQDTLISIRCDVGKRETKHRWMNIYHDRWEKKGSNTNSRTGATNTMKRNWKDKKQQMKQKTDDILTFELVTVELNVVSSLLMHRISKFMYEQKRKQYQSLLLFQF